MAKKLDAICGMPQMTTAFRGWKKDITMEQVTQSINAGGFRENTKIAFTKKGVLQPLSPEILQTKPDGQRSWTWLQLHLETNVIDFKTDDVVSISDTQYKIMQVNDFHLNNYVEYHLILDFKQ